MARETIKVDSVGEAYLAVLKDRGVDYLFGNAGTDFASIIEGLSKAVAEGTKAPTPITVPHENVAVAMAHGFYMVTGRPQAVMVHVNVGTANAICGVLNAYRQNIPIIFSSGRTPLYEDGPAGARSLFIHWGQEMFDQAAMLREAVKWDYELRDGRQVETVVDRAVGVAMSEPRGPVYLTLPREVLAQAPGEFSYDSPTRRTAARPPAADPAAIDEAADMLAKAENPLIVTASFGLNTASVETLGALADRFALPVSQYRPRYLCLPSDHPMHMGYEPAGLLKDADVVLVLDCDVPWIPSLHKLNPNAKVIQVGVDPLYSNYPIRGFAADLAITGESGLALAALAEAMESREAGAKGRIDARRARLADARGKMRDNWSSRLDGLKDAAAIDAAWVAHCLNGVMGQEDILVSESQLPLFHLDRTKPGTYFATSASGGLGWGVGAALGAKLGARDKRVFSVVGDGSYMFGNPTPAHYVSAANDLPVLTIILNNSMWGSVRKATLGIYPDGAAARINRAPLTYLEPSPDYHKIVEASGGYGEEVRTPGDLPGALERAAKAVDVDKRQAVLNVHTFYSDDAALADARR